MTQARRIPRDAPTPILDDLVRQQLRAELALNQDAASAALWPATRKRIAHQLRVSVATVDRALKSVRPAPSKRPRLLEFGVAREACEHAERLLVTSRGVNLDDLEVHDGGRDPLLRCGAVEWCRACGGIRFGLSGRFIVPRNLRVPR